jgi:DNA-binding response OmpR family regulator
MVKKILIVEDDQVMRSLYIDLLTAEGFSVDTAVDGEEAYTKLSTASYDLVLLDYLLPKLNGDMVLAKLSKEHPEISRPRVLFITNYDKVQADKYIGNLGYSYFVKSDLTPENFVKKIKEFISI